MFTIEMIGMIGMIGIIAFLLIVVNLCYSTDWNNGFCPNCESRYELRGISNGLKAYVCPNCGKEVFRY